MVKTTFFRGIKVLFYAAKAMHTFLTFNAFHDAILRTLDAFHLYYFIVIWGVLWRAYCMVAEFGLMLS